MFAIVVQTAKGRCQFFVVDKCTGLNDINVNPKLYLKLRTLDSHPPTVYDFVLKKQIFIDTFPYKVILDSRH